MIFRLYPTLIKQSLKETMMYKTTTILTVIFGIAFYLIDVLAGGVYFSFAQKIAGWRFIDFLNLITTTNLISYGYQFLFVAAHENLADVILEGNLDQYLIKPINSFAFYALYRVDFASMINFIITVIIEGVLMAITKISLIHLLFYIIFIILGIGLLFAINQILTTVTFWLPKMTAIMGIPELLVDFGNRPAKIYPRIIQNIFSLIFPILLVTNIPAKECTGNFDYVASLWVLLIDCLLIAFSYWEWKCGLRHYESAN